METIQLRDFCVGYHLDKGRVRRVVSGMNASIRSGELTCLIGSNGIGKSTLLRTLSAFQPPLSGDCFILGKPIKDYTHSELARTIGVVLTRKPHINYITVKELVGMGRAPYTGFWGTLSKEDDKIVDESISMVGIDHLKYRMVTHLSDGERQKVMIAKALAQQTPVIFLDEPTAFLDFSSKVEMMKLLKRLAHDMDKTIFLSTHDLELAVKLADVLWQLDESGLHAVAKEEVQNEIDVLLAL